MTSSRPTSIVPTPEQLRAIAHPLRSRLLGLLRADGPQTSAELARATGQNTGATSYHLQMLASYGFIEDDHERSSGRKRYWRAVHTLTEVPDDTVGFSGPELGDRAAFRQAVTTTYATSAQAATQEWSELPAEWRDATEFSDILVRLTPAEAIELRSRIGELLEEYLQRFPAESDEAPEGAELYQLQVQGFPFPGRIPRRDEA